MTNFAIIGVAGFVAPKHLQAIKNIGGKVVLAHDVSDAVGVLDSYFPECFFYTNLQDFSTAIQQHSIDFLVVCTPNFLHVEHCIFGLMHNLNVICEKPLVLNTEEIILLKERELEYNKKIYTILQLRLHEQVQYIKNSIDNEKYYVGQLSYFTPRGNWYHQSWKGIEVKSGGIATNIGVHFFDMLCWFFGKIKHIELIEKNDTTSKGMLHFEKAKIHWHLCIDRNLEPTRKIILNDEEYIFTDGFHHLHTQCYKNILEGNGFGIDENYAATQVIYEIRNSNQP